MPLCIAFGLSYGAYKGFGVELIRISSATNRVVLEQCRVVVVWVFFLLYPGDGHEEFSVGKLLGFFLIVLGVLIFNKIIGLGQEAEPTASDNPLTLGNETRSESLVRSDEKTSLLSLTNGRAC